MSITPKYAVYLRNVLVDIGTKEELEAQYKGPKWLILPYLKAR